MKPIFIIIFPDHVPREKIAEIKSKEEFEEIKKEYHLLIVIGRVDNIEFKLLNGSKENFDSLEEVMNLVKYEQN